METIIDFLMQYISAWAPALMSVLGIAAMIITGFSKVGAAVDKIKDTKDFKELKDEIKKQCEENEKVKSLIETITEKMKDFDEKAAALLNSEEIIKSYEKLEIEELKSTIATLNRLYSNIMATGGINESNNSDTQEEI